jgi:hypothetical protein
MSRTSDRSAGSRATGDLPQLLTELAAVKTDLDDRLRAEFPSSLAEIFHGLGDSAPLRAAQRLFDVASPRGGKLRTEAVETLEAMVRQETQSLRDADPVELNPFREGIEFAPMTRERKARMTRTMLIEPLMANPKITPRMYELLGMIRQAEIRIADLLVAVGRKRARPYTNRYPGLLDNVQLFELPYPAGSRLFEEATANLEASLVRAVAQSRNILAALEGAKSLK